MRPSVHHFRLALCCVFRYAKPLVLMQVRRSAFMLHWEGFKALVDLFVLGRLLLRLLLLRVGEVGGNSCCWGAVAGCCPDRGLEHLHGVAPLAGGAAQRVQRAALAGQRTGDRGRVLPGCLRRPGFGFVILTKQKRLGGFLFVWIPKHLFFETILNTASYPSLRHLQKINLHLKAELMPLYSTLNS